MTTIERCSQKPSFIYASETGCRRSIRIAIKTFSAFRKERDFLRRVPEKTWSSLLEKVVTRLDKGPLSSDAIEAFRHGKWDHPIFKHDWLLLAFYAYLEGRLEEKYLPKLLLYDACHQEAWPADGVKTFQLIGKNGKVHPNAREAFTEGLKRNFTPQRIDAVIKKLMTLPPETGQFFQITRRYLDRPPNIIDRIEETGFHPFFEPSTNVLTVIPPELIHETLQVLFGDLARKPNPVMGFFKIEKMSDADQRVVSLSLRQHIPLPSELDGILATPLGHYQHDAIYHLFIDSANPHRKAWIEIAQYFKESGETDLANNLFDGEHIPYRNSLIFLLYKTKQDLFWESLVKNIAEYPSNKRLIDLFWNYFKNHSERWDREYRLTIEDLGLYIDRQKRHAHLRNDKSEHMVIQLLKKKAKQGL